MHGNSRLDEDLEIIKIRQTIFRSAKSFLAALEALVLVIIMLTVIWARDKSQKLLSCHSTNSLQSFKWIPLLILQSPLNLQLIRVKVI